MRYHVAARVFCFCTFFFFSSLLNGVPLRVLALAFLHEEM
jgi:hypothetical protein